MAIQQSFYKREITAAGSVPAGWESIPLNENIEQYHIFSSGLVALGCDWYLIPKVGDIPVEGMRITIRYEADIDLNGHTITIFGYVLNVWQASHNNLFELRYDGSAWIMFLYEDHSVLPPAVEGTEIITLTAGGGAITLVPSLNTKNQIVQGGATIGANWTITQAGVPGDGDSFNLIYEAAMIYSGAFSITIFGYTLSREQALLKRLEFTTVYSDVDSLWHTVVKEQPYNNVWKQIYFVGKHGNNSNDGLTPDGAFLTFAAAIAAASATIPSPTKRYVIECFDAGIYTENLVIPEYVVVNAPSATFVGYQMLDGDENGLICRDITYTGSNIMVNKTAGSTTNSYCKAERIIGTGVAIGVGADMGTLIIDVGMIKVQNGMCITNSGNSCTILGQVSEMWITAGGVGVVATGAGMTLSLIFGRIYAVAGTGVYFESSTVNLSGGIINTGAGIACYADATTILNMNICDVVGVKQFILGSVVEFNGSNIIHTTLSHVDGIVTIPAGKRLVSIIVKEKAGFAITGGLKIGTTAGGTEVVNAHPVSANELVDCPLGMVMYSLTVPQVLYIRAFTAWNNAVIDVYIKSENIG